MFLIRTAFWLSIIILLLPMDDAEQEVAGQANLSAGQMFTAARSTLFDVANICDRNPQVCSTGQAALETFGRKAVYGAGLLADAVSNATVGEESSAPQTASPEPLAAATPRPSVPLQTSVPLQSGVARTVPLPGAAQSAPPATISRNTLTPDDLGPQWNGPGLNG